MNDTETQNAETLSILRAIISTGFDGWISLKLAGDGRNFTAIRAPEKLCAAQLKKLLNGFSDNAECDALEDLT